jgi:gas vesicle protein
MRFVLGLLIGFAIGLGGAILFAPDKRKAVESGWPPHREETSTAGGANHRDGGALRGALGSLRERLNEALTEAKAASQQAEKDMMARYYKMAGQTPPPGTEKRPGARP